MGIAFPIWTEGVTASDLSLLRLGSPGGGEGGRGDGAPGTRSPTRPEAELLAPGHF